MLANLTPEESVNRGLVRPSACDIFVTIFWGRMGTPLEKPLKKDKTRYLSGTEWELEDAAPAASATSSCIGAQARVTADVDDPAFDEIRAQKKLVD